MKFETIEHEKERRGIQLTSTPFLQVQDFFFNREKHSKNLSTAKIA